MPQRVDDVTGKPFSLSATDREAQRHAMTQRVTDLTLANNQLYARVVDLETRLADLQAAVGVLAVSLEAFRHGQTRRERLRWLVTGR